MLESLCACLIYEACGSGESCQGSHHMQWAVHPGGSWQVSSRWDANMKHVGRFLWDWGGGWETVFMAPLSLTVTMYEIVGQKYICQGVPGEHSRIRHWGNLLVKGCLKHLCRVVKEACSWEPHSQLQNLPPCRAWQVGRSLDC